MKIIRMIFVLVAMLLATHTLNAQMQSTDEPVFTPDALKQLEKEAKKGDIMKQIALASAYSRGAFGLSKDLNKALEWGKKAYKTGEKQGNPIGIACYLGILMENEKNIPNAASEIRILGTQGDLTNNPYCLGPYGGWLLMQGEINEGLKRLNQAANLGMVESMNTLTTLYLGNEGVTANPESAFKWATKSSEFGNPEGMRNLVNFYANGIGTEKDISKAIYWGDKAKDAGVECSDLLCNIYITSDNFEDQKKGFDFLYANKSAPEPSVWKALAYCYEKGIGTAKDESEAVQWYELASLGDDEYATWRLADAKLNGSLGLNQDIDGAIAELNQMLEQGSIQAFISLDNWYFDKYDGASLIKFYTMAIDNIDKFPFLRSNQMHWQIASIYDDKKMGVKDVENQRMHLKAITDASTAEYHTAQGVLLFDKQFGEPNYEKAVKHFEWVIDNKDAEPILKREAYKKLASAYRYGRGVAMDEAKADEYLHQQELLEQQLNYSENSSDKVSTMELMRNLGL